MITSVTKCNIRVFMKEICFGTILFFCFACISLLFPFGCSSQAVRMERVFFQNEGNSREIFRIFISKDRYKVHQVQFHDRIQRIQDRHGDQEKKLFFTKEHNKMAFSDFKLEGKMLVRIDPISGTPTDIQYKKGKVPKTWQAGKHFIQDISRFRFSFPSKSQKIFSFTVSYLWNITALKGLSSKQRRKKAIKYLRSQK